MTIETALYPNQLNATLPPQSDIVREGAGHLRLLKTVVKTTFPNLGGAWNATQAEANYIVGVTSPIQAQINSKGAIAGQTWTGAHVFSGTAAVPTLAQGTSTTGAASTAFVQAEWATRLPNYTAPITANSTELNRLVGVTSGVQSQINSKAAKAGDTYTGAHNFTGGALKAPTMTAGTATTDVATTAFVASAAFSAVLPGQTGNAGKVISTNGTNASWVNPVFPTPYADTSADTDAVAFGRYRLTASLDLTLPPAQTDGDWVDVVNTSGTTTARILRNAQSINGLAEDLTIDANYAAFRLVYRTGYGWFTV